MRTDQPKSPAVQRPTATANGRFKENPFISDMIIPVGKKSVRLSRLGKNDNIVIDGEIGESRGAHVTTYRKVDSEQFVKIFTANIGLTFDLTSAGIKAFSVLLWSIQHQSFTKDEVPLDVFVLTEFIEIHANDVPPLKLSHGTFLRGLAELVKAKIIAKTLRAGRYFINPSFVFNGDRIAFTTILQRVDSDAQNQQSLPLEE